MRLTEEEAVALGLVKDSKGNWSDGRRTNIQRDDSGKVPKLESGSLHAAKSSDAVQGEDARGGDASYRIVVTAYCRWHTDPDNLCPKWFIDRLRESAIIPDDSSRHIREFTKKVEKVEAWEPEVTKIEVYRIL